MKNFILVLVCLFCFLGCNQDKKQNNPDQVEQTNPDQAKRTPPNQVKPVDNTLENERIKFFGEICSVYGAVFNCLQKERYNFSNCEDENTRVVSFEASHAEEMLKFYSLNTIDQVSTPLQTEPNLRMTQKEIIDRAKEIYASNIEIITKNDYPECKEMARI